MQEEPGSQRLRGEQGIWGGVALYRGWDSRRWKKAHPEERRQCVGHFCPEAPVAGEGGDLCVRGIPMTGGQMAQQNLG